MVRWLAGAALLAVLGAGMAACGREQTGPQGATLIVECTPSEGVQVTVDGVDYGAPPARLEGLQPGRVVVVAEKEGYKREAVTVNVPPDAAEVKKTITLEQECGWVTLESEPTGAEVYLDGTELLGKTPLRARSVPVGAHTFEFRLPDYGVEVREETIEPDYRYTIVPQLDPLDAELTVYSKPTGASIYLNDEIIPEKTPARIKAPPGEYTVSVYMKGYIMTDDAVVLGPNDKKKVEITMPEGNAPPGMVLVPEGPFTMGADKAAPDEAPAHEVNVAAFYMDKYEVTNKEFKAVFPAHTFEEGREMYPASGVSLVQAEEFAEAVGKRLPTEEEWEKAARGVKKWEYPWGMEFEKDKCNYDDGRGTPEIERVGRYRAGASPYGCMDMAGNVMEWTTSWYQPYPGNSLVTKDYGQVFRVLRGGAYDSSPFHVRTLRRHFDHPTAAKPQYGFRCVKDVEEDEAGS